MNFSSLHLITFLLFFSSLSSHLFTILFALGIKVVFLSNKFSVSRCRGRHYAWGHLHPVSEHRGPSPSSASCASIPANAHSGISLYLGPYLPPGRPSQAVGPWLGHNPTLACVGIWGMNRGREISVGLSQSVFLFYTLSLFQIKIFFLIRNNKQTKRLHW